MLLTFIPLLFLSLWVNYKEYHRKTTTRQACFVNCCFRYYLFVNNGKQLYAFLKGLVIFLPFEIFPVTRVGSCYFVSLRFSNYNLPFTKARSGLKRAIVLRILYFLVLGRRWSILDRSKQEESGKFLKKPWCCFGGSITR